MEILKLIADNQLLFDTVKAEVLKQFALDDLTTEKVNEELGAIVRARLDGREAVERAFTAIASFKTSLKAPGTTNPGR